MGRFDNSVMVTQSKQNADYIDAMRLMLKQRRNAGIETNFIDKNKNRAKEFSFWRYIFSKHDKTGRFGARKLREKDDSISKLNHDTMPKGIYFDPLGMKTIKENTGPDKDKNPTISGSVYDEQFLDNEDPEQAKISQIEEDYVSRVGDEITNIQENDFEAKRNDEITKMAFATGITDKNEESYKQDYNAGRAFVPDKFEEKIPNSFNVRLAVADPPPAYSQEWDQYKAVNTKGMWANVKGWFRRVFKKPAPSEDDLLVKFAEKLPEYQQLLSKGKAEAAEAKEKYEPEADLELQNYLSQLKGDFKRSSYGHSSVSMIAKKDGKEVSKYSFCFASTGNPGMAGTIIGTVANPTQYSDMDTFDDNSVSYANFLRAAAKIRATAGSMRQYSMIGYNCASFATDVGKAAGIKLKDADTSGKIMTHRHHSQKVDSPYYLASYIKKQQRAKGVASAFTREEREKIEEERKLNLATRVTETAGRFMPTLMQNPTVTMLTQYNLVSKEEIDKGFRKYLNDVIIKCDDIDREFPVNGIPDDEIRIAKEARINRRMEEFGVPSEDNYISQFCRDQEKILTCFVKDPSNANEMMDRFFGKTTDMDYKNRETSIIKFFNSPFAKEYYPGVSEIQLRKLGKELLPKINKAQIDLRSEIETAGLSGSKLLMVILEKLDGYNPMMLGNRIFESSAMVKQFCQKHNIKLPEAEKESPKEKEGKVAKQYTMDDFEKSFKEVEDPALVERFIKTISQKEPIEGRWGQRPLTRYGICIFFRNVIKNKDMMRGISAEYAEWENAESQEQKLDVFVKMLEVILGHPKPRFLANKLELTGIQ